MPRLPRVDVPGVAQHVIQRGNNRQLCFASDDDFVAYSHWLKEYAEKHETEIHAWVFMTNHVHLLMTSYQKGGISKLMQSLGRKYVQYFNYKYKRTGTLWEGRFRSCLVESDLYVLVCYRYIELNPIRANMVEKPKGYRWSSYSRNALGVNSSMCTSHVSYLALGESGAERLIKYRDLFRGILNDKVIDDIRMITQQGLVLGSDQFRKQLQELLGRRLECRRRGRPRIKNGSDPF